MGVCIIDFAVFASLIVLNLDFVGIWANHLLVERLLATIIIITVFFKYGLWKKNMEKILLFCLLSYTLFFPIKKENIELILPFLFVVVLMYAKVCNYVVKPMLVIAILRLGISCLPFLSYAYEFFSDSVSSLLNFGTPLGSSLCGWFSLFYSMSFFIFSALTKRILWRKCVKWISLCFAVYWFTLVLLTLLLLKTPMIGLNLLILYPLGQWACLLFSDINVKNKEILCSSNKRFSIGIGCICLVCSVILNMYEPQRMSDDTVSVTLVNKGLLVDYTAVIPENTYGFLKASSPFLMLPKYLKTFGFDVRIVDTIQEVDWNTTDILTLINFNNDFEENMPELLEEFVKNGGALCVVGDHTNIGRTTKIMNSLIKWAKIQINDDTSDSLLHPHVVWNNSLMFQDTLITAGLGEHSDVQIWGGASVKIDIFSFPLILGKYALSDNPDPLNIGYGGRLGNRKPNYGEKAGNTVLITTKKYGCGRIAVFGDTSPFQLTSLATDWLFVSRLYTWLSSKSLIPCLNIIKIFAFATIFFIINYSLWIVEDLPQRTVVVALLIGLVLAQVFNISLAKKFDSNMIRKYASESIAVIDTSKGEKIELSQLSKSSGMGLAYNLMRYGLVPLFGNYKKLPSKTIFFAAPTERFTHNDIVCLMSKMKQGGSVFLAAGWESEEVVTKLLNNLEMRILPVMLGPVPWKNPNIPETMKITGPEFKEAYPIEVSEDLEIYYEFNGYPLVCVKSVGSGSFVLIGDHRYFFSDNLEGEMIYNKENIKFMQQLLHDILGR